MNHDHQSAASARRVPWTQALNVFFASFGFVAIRFILGPVRIKVLTSLLTKEQYGALTLISLTVSFITLVASLGSLEFLLRKVPGRPVYYQNSIFKTILLFFGGVSVAVALAGMGLLWWSPPSRIPLGPPEILACGLLLVLTVHLNQYTHFLLGLSKYALSRIAQLLSADTWFLPLLVFFWVGTIQIGHVLWVWVIWLLFTVLIMQRYIHFPRVWSTKASRTELTEILQFGLPLVPMILGEWLFYLQDRYILFHLMDLEAVANYALCAGIAMVGTLVLGAVLDILLTEFFKLRNQVSGESLDALAGHAELRRSFTLMLRYTLLIGLPTAAAMLTLGRPIIRLLSDAKFLDAAPILAWLAPFPVFYQLSVICGRLLLGVNRSALVGVATLLAALANIPLNFLLVPHLGERGAALSVSLCFFVLTLYLGWRARVWKWVEWRDLGLARGLLFFLACAVVFGQLERWIGSWGVLAVLLVAGVWTLVAAVLLSLARKTDLQLILGTFVQEPAAAPSETPPV